MKLVKLTHAKTGKDLHVNPDNVRGVFLSFDPDNDPGTVVSYSETHAFVVAEEIDEVVRMLNGEELLH